MDIASPTPLLGGLSPTAFMKRHWQRKPLLIRQAVRGGLPLLNATGLFKLAARDDVQSRLIERRGGIQPGSASSGAAAAVAAIDGTSAADTARTGAASPAAAAETADHAHDRTLDHWTLRHGPFRRRALPPLTRPGWTLLVQGVDLHLDAAHALLSRFRFAPDARLDDLMLSFATDGGGVGPHVDSYDVFLLQLSGRRRWRIGRLVDPALRPGLPLKILSRFAPSDEWLLDAGDMLYLPPNWAHDGVAEGACMTASIGFRAASRDEVATQVLQRLLDAAAEDAADPASGVKAAGALPASAPSMRSLYRDPGQPATASPARIPPWLADFSAAAVARLLAAPQLQQRALGEWLSEPPSNVWYDAPASLQRSAGIRLDRRTRMLYDDRHLFVNGESFATSGRDAVLLRQLADDRWLDSADVAGLSAQAWRLLQAWAQAGWLLADAPPASRLPAPAPNRHSQPSPNPRARHRRSVE